MCQSRIRILIANCTLWKYCKIEHQNIEIINFQYFIWFLCKDNHLLRNGIDELYAHSYRYWWIGCRKFHKLHASTLFRTCRIHINCSPAVLITSYMDANPYHIKVRKPVNAFCTNIIRPGTSTQCLHIRGISRLYPYLLLQRDCLNVIASQLFEE